MAAGETANSFSTGPGTLHQLDIESLAYNGYGVGRLDGRVFFVPFTAPGDRVECRIVRSRKNCFFAETTRILTASLNRREPPCPVFATCGGCHWQHLPYSDQTSWKTTIFRDMLQRQAKVPDGVFVPMIPSSSEFHYRSRAQFKCRQTGQDFLMGFYRRESHYVIDILECPLMAPEINKVFKLFRLWLSRSPYASHIPQIDITVDDCGSIRAVVHFLGNIGKQLAAALRPLAENEKLALFFQSDRNRSLRKICGVEELYLYPLGAGAGMSLAFGPGSFSQVHLDQNRNLVREVRDAARLSGRERVLDLFCGNGNLSLPLATDALEVVGIENYSPAVRQAKLNVQRNNLENVRFQSCSAEKAILELGSENKFDLVVLDPPREGAYQTIKGILKLDVDRIIYVSCNPSTLARDLGPLIQKGYRVARVRLFDFFPQTFHVESMILLEKS